MAGTTSALQDAFLPIAEDSCRVARLAASSPLAISTSPLSTQLIAEDSCRVARLAAPFRRNKLDSRPSRPSIYTVPLSGVMEVIYDVVERKRTPP